MVTDRGGACHQTLVAWNGIAACAQDGSMTLIGDPHRPSSRSALFPGGMGVLLSAAAHAALLPLVGMAWLGTPHEDRQEEIVLTLELVPAPPTANPIASPAPAPTPPPPAPQRLTTKPRPLPSRPLPSPAPAAQSMAPSAPNPVDRPDTAADVAAVPAEPPPAAAGPAAQPDFAAYARRLLEQLERHKTYPPLSARRGEEGIVTLRLVLARDGTVLSVEPSGDAPHRLVLASLEAVQAAAPFAPVPADFTGASAVFTLPIAYRLR